MKLTEELKKKLEQAKSKEEALIIFQEAGMILTDDELEIVSGGEGKPLYEIDGLNGSGFDSGNQPDMGKNQRTREEYCENKPVNDIAPIDAAIHGVPGGNGAVWVR